MIKQVKKALIDHPEKLMQLLEHFGYQNIKERKTYISCGRDENSSPKAIVIRKNNNDSCFVIDYARGLSTDILALISKERGVDFKTVLSAAKEILNDDLVTSDSYEVFGGLLRLSKPHDDEEILGEIKPVDLSSFVNFPNKRFMRDGIGPETQKYFGICVDPIKNDIIIPIFSPDGIVMGAKARRNQDDAVNKYYYRYPCKMSQTLYGYSQNYLGLVNSDLVVIVEAEKSVMQAYEFGFRKIIAIGSSSISKVQAKLIAGLNPKKVCLMMDKGIKEEAVEANCQLLKKMLMFRDCHIYIWVPNESVPDKSSPTDLGKRKFLQALGKELILWKPK